VIVLPRERGRDGAMGRWGDGEMERWSDGERGRWGDGEMVKNFSLFNISFL